jgi:hypothetical protein
MMISKSLPKATAVVVVKEEEGECDMRNGCDHERSSKDSEAVKGAELRKSSTVPVAALGCKRLDDACFIVILHIIIIRELHLVNSYRYAQADNPDCFHYMNVFTNLHQKS